MPENSCEMSCDLLLIEDDHQDEECIRRALSLSAESFQVTVARRLIDGIEILERQQFDVVLSDLSLPDSQGMDTIRQLLKAAGNSPIMVLSGLEDERITKEALGLGALGFLIKGQTSGGYLAEAIMSVIQRDQTKEQAITELYAALA